MAEQGPHDSPAIHYSFLAIPLVGYDLLEETPRWAQYRPYSQPTACTTTCIHPTPDLTINTRRFLYTNLEGPVTILLPKGSMDDHMPRPEDYHATDKRYPMPVYLMYSDTPAASATKDE